MLNNSMLDVLFLFKKNDRVIEYMSYQPVENLRFNIYLVPAFDFESQTLKTIFFVQVGDSCQSFPRAIAVAACHAELRYGRSKSSAQAGAGAIIRTKSNIRSGHILKYFALFFLPARIRAPFVYSRYHQEFCIIHVNQ
jgi:hypothetical protein